jgi:beta-N-acetylhexosaminidase
MTVAKAIVDVAGLELTQEDKEFLKNPTIAGVILFTRNYESRAQLKALTQSIHKINPDLIICVDQEGGRVQRFRDGFSDLAAMHTFGELFLKDQKAALIALEKQLLIMIKELQEVGVTATLIPVLDLDFGRSEIIGERSFGRDPGAVTQLASFVIDTMHRFNMPATIKHFPGHGHVKADSHLDLPVDNRSFEELLAADLIPFINLLPKADFVMPAHIIFPQVDHRPVGFSPVWLRDILRGQLQYRGKIITDDLSMQGAAEFGDYNVRAEAAIDAGCDFLLVCNNRDGAIGVVTTLEKGLTVTH